MLGEISTFKCNHSSANSVLVIFKSGSNSLSASNDLNALLFFLESLIIVEEDVSFLECSFVYYAVDCTLS